MPLVGQIQAQNPHRPNQEEPPGPYPHPNPCPPPVFTVGKPSDLHHRLNTASFPPF
ncbi:hypothetical protein LZ31DRAFT_552580 [Colletotrichum somersetense]|nr:hypothetical protein LZ31DRAFT_552580 [Colletotrichum somersetense]